MKKLLPLFAVFAFISASAQFQENAPWMQSFDLQNRTTPILFQDIVDAGNAYFNTIDKDAKGSGYKPFKRWESYWQNYIGPDGYMPTNGDLWNVWQEAQAFDQNRDALDDESNWTNVGLSGFSGRPTSLANIGRGNVIVPDPNDANIFYAGAPSGGVWKSTDAGNCVALPRC